MTSNIFKKSKDCSLVNKETYNEYKSDIYVPPSKRNINKVITTSQKGNIFINNVNQNLLKEKQKSRPLYRVTDEKLQSLEIFPELNSNDLKYKNKIQQPKENKLWFIKKTEENVVRDEIINDVTSNSINNENNHNNYNNNDDNDDNNSKLYVPEGWLLLSEFNKGKSLSQLEKERDERIYYQQLEQYYANMRYLMKERNAIKKKLYIIVGEYFGYDSIILRDMPLKLDFLNESDNELEDNNTDSDINSSGGESENEYDENSRY